MDNIIQFPTPVKTQEQLVFDFMEAFDTPRTPEFWKTLIEEEAKETAVALSELLGEMADVRYVTQGFINSGGTPEEAIDILCTHVDEFILNDVTEALLDNGVVDEAFLRKHAANMSKLLEDGTVLRREDGKVLKGPNFKPAVLLDLVQPFVQPIHQ